MDFFKWIKTVYLESNGYKGHEIDCNVQRKKAGEKMLLTELKSLCRFAIGYTPNVFEIVKNIESVSLGRDYRFFFALTKKSESFSLKSIFVQYLGRAMLLKTDICVYYDYDDDKYLGSITVNSRHFP